MSIAICAIILAVVSAPLHAQEYPNRVVRLIVPYLPGEIGRAHV